jgi:DNA-binding transcriptional regulator YiaG
VAIGAKIVSPQLLCIPRVARMACIACYSNCHNTCITAGGTAIFPEMLDTKALAAIRARLGLSQEHMARLLGVSFASVNRWEAGHSSPTGPTLDIYKALTAAIRAGHSPEAIRQAANAERGAFLLALFRMGYAKSRRSAR